MSTAKQNRVRKKRGPDEKSTGPLGSVELVGTDGDKIRIELMDVCESLFAKPLHSVCVKENTPRTAKRPDFPHRLQSSHLVVGGHHRHQDGIRTKGMSDTFHGHLSAGIHWQKRHIKSLPALEILETVQHGVMLDR